jgi:hypothetical protein
VASHVLQPGHQPAESAVPAAAAAAAAAAGAAAAAADDDTEPVQMSEEECFMFDLHGFLIVRNFLAPGTPGCAGSWVVAFAPPLPFQCLE